MRLHTLALISVMALAVASAQQAPPPPPGDPNGAPNSAVDPGGPPDEPGRSVARISVLSGDASVRRGDSPDWVAAALNAPLMVGDSVSVAPGGAVEIQLDATSFARLAGDSEVRISEFEAGRYQLQLAKGLVTYRVLRQTNAQAEIDTPLAAVRPIGLASVRAEVAPDGTSRIVVRHGDVEVNTKRGEERVHEGNMMLIKGTADDPEFQVVNAPAGDPWDTWSDQRDAYLQRAQSPRYVSQDIYGTEDLDNYGRWNNDPQYGDVWTPTVPATWAPYRDGRWVWEDYYGWTWVDASPWGWAPFHYGSWYFRTGFGWSWFPGHRGDRFWYRPALVGFFGFGGGPGFGFGFGFGNIGWIPLGPYERFHPWYGRGWFGGRNVVVNNVNIVRNGNITGLYRNARFAGGVTAVSGADFQRGNFRNNVSVGSEQLRQASLVRGAVPVTPAADHLRFSDRASVASGPRADVGNQRFFSHMAGSVAPQQRTPFTQQQASVRSAFESRGIQTNSPAPSAQPGRQFGGVSNAPSASAGAAPGWNRFGSPQTSPQRTSAGAPSRSLQVSPQIVHQRPAPSGYSQQPAYRAPAPSQAPRSAPAPSYRSAPAPAPRSSGGGGSGGGGHSGGSSGGHGGRR